MHPWECHRERQEGRWGAGARRRRARCKALSAPLRSCPHLPHVLHILGLQGPRRHWHQATWQAESRMSSPRGAARAVCFPFNGGTQPPPSKCRGDESPKPCFVLAGGRRELQPTLSVIQKNIH